MQNLTEFAKAAVILAFLFLCCANINPWTGKTNGKAWFVHNQVDVSWMGSKRLTDAITMLFPA